MITNPFELKQKPNDVLRGFVCRKESLLTDVYSLYWGSRHGLRGGETAWHPHSLLGPVVSVINAEFIIAVKDPAIRYRCKGFGW